jgi:ABC-type multidrug transport system permease subunit
MSFIWFLLGIVYLMCLIFLGVATFRKGHYVLFVLGFFLPFLWIIGALIRPTARAAARFAAPA